ncbi:hypothetical protein GBA52_022757 [Prunus armeniaca]|nr:hypothetical protein GBA52_022757 [Prunus armeniaca]
MCSFEGQAMAALKRFEEKDVYCGLGQKLFGYDLAVAAANSLHLEFYIWKKCGELPESSSFLYK